MKTSFTGVTVAAALLFVSGALKAENWPQFRGAGGQGVASEKNLPLKWSATASAMAVSRR